LSERHPVSAAPVVQQDGVPLEEAAALLQEEREASRDRPAREESSQRIAAEDQVQQRLVEEMTEYVHRTWKYIIAGCMVGLVLLLATLYLFVAAVIASIRYNDVPCDQPLRYYMLLSLTWAQIPNRMMQWAQRNYQLSSARMVAATIIVSIPGWLILGWGLYMIDAAKTCPKTNPNLYWPTRHYIQIQALFTVLLMVISIMSLLGLRQVLLVLNKLSVKPGCEKAVRELPKVRNDAPELIDAADGQAVDCIVCMEPLTDARDVVRAPCAHHFHEECLATWCKNHLDCPTCRRQIAPSDAAEIV